MTEQRAMRLVETYGVKVKTTPSEALLELVQWSAGHVAYLRDRVQELGANQAADAEIDEYGDEDDTHDGEPGEQQAPGPKHPLVWGVTRVKQGGDDRGVTQEAGANTWLALYNQERDRLARYCADALRAGVEERRVRLAEQHGQLLVEVIRGILADLELTPEQQARVPEVVPRRLRAVAA